MRFKHEGHLELVTELFLQGKFALPLERDVIKAICCCILYKMDLLQAKAALANNSSAVRAYMDARRKLNNVFLELIDLMPER